MAQSFTTTRSPLRVLVPALLASAVMVSASLAGAQQTATASRDLEAKASEAASAVMIVRDGVAAPAQSTRLDSPEKVAWLLESASQLLADLAQRASNGETTSQARKDITQIARYLNAALETAKAAEVQTDAQDMETLTIALTALVEQYAAEEENARP